jgi:hypothetical protein
MTTVQRLAHFVVDRSWDDPVGRFVKTQLPPRSLVPGLPQQRRES